MTKAVCSRHQVAYEASTGCADCLAMERDAYHARGLPDDDADTYLVTPEMVTDAFVNAYDRGGWREATAEQVLADLAVLAERLKVPQRAHEYSLLTCCCIRCGEPLSIAIGHGL